MIYKMNPLINNALSINDYPPKIVDLMESKINYQNPNPVPVDELSQYFRTYLFDFDYPLDNQYKEDFEISFLDHYINRRIGFETYTYFKMQLKVKLKSIMPKYNKMLEGFSTLDFLGEKEIHVRNENETGNSSSNSTNDNRYSQVPQNEIQDVQNGTYLTDYTYNSGTNLGNASRNTNENINITKLDSIDEYEKFLKFANNIYDEIFKECDSLFFKAI